ncbi:hypothetical protein KAFR_0I01090 [Kazachstania africana CBS 2517]|uniref:Uncharacterized protein n=1 Tax=Kazachstania africana (strain ATCC 22294 / BCRC 22015 / CBS 2517 / CECT 1963 / NBRC 1671 / NRRL Y-8276) TaxID=1071382 RepID=H2AZU0_KAZAF|nr:hypothetical protein KAFR_0I01090 [Kazachstania africana CBS 2517]CCF59890.1 hypothetical protein KAFR_0I01090 [Kazachstania africana CBS 2517]
MPEKVYKDNEEKISLGSKSTRPPKDPPTYEEVMRNDGQEQNSNNFGDAHGQVPIQRPTYVHYPHPNSRSAFPGGKKLTYGSSTAKNFQK